MTWRIIALSGALGLAASHGDTAGSASVQTSVGGPLRVKSALYAQAQLTGRTADANRNLPQGTLLGIFLFSQADACDALADVGADGNALISAGPSTAFPWLQLTALSAGVGTLAPGTYFYVAGSPSTDLTMLPQESGAGSASGTLYGDGVNAYPGSDGSTLSLSRLDGNVDAGRVEGNFLLSFGANGSFSARYCANLSALMNLAVSR